MKRPEIEWIENFYKQDEVWESSATIVELCGYIKFLESAVEEARDILGDSRPYVATDEAERQWVAAVDQLEKRIAEAQGE
mgnify:FL=1